MNTPPVPTSPTTPYILLLIGILVSVCAQIAMKEGMRRIGFFEFTSANLLPIGWRIFTNPFILLGMTGYVIGMLLWLMVLSRLELSLAYPLISLSYIVALAAGYFLFDEAVTLSRVLGVAIIMVGVIFITRPA